MALKRPLKNVLERRAKIYVTLLLDLSHLVLFIVHRNDFIFQSHVLCMHNIAGLRLYRDKKKLPVDTTVLLYVLLILNSPSLQNQRLREIAVAVFPRSVMTTLSNSHGRALPTCPTSFRILGGSSSCSTGSSGLWNHLGAKAQTKFCLENNP